MRIGASLLIAVAISIMSGCSLNPFNDRSSKSTPPLPKEIVRLSYRNEDTLVDKYLLNRLKLNPQARLDSTLIRRGLEKEPFMAPSSFPLGILRIENNNVFTLSQNELDSWKKGMDKYESVAVNLIGEYTDIHQVVKKVRGVHPHLKYLVLYETKYWYRRSLDTGVLGFTIIGTLAGEGDPDSLNTKLFAQLVVLDLHASLPYLTVEETISAHSLPKEFNGSTPKEKLYSESIRLCGQVLGPALQRKITALSTYSNSYAQFVSNNEAKSTQ